MPRPIRFLDQGGALARTRSWARCSRPAVRSRSGVAAATSPRSAPRWRRSRRARSSASSRRAACASTGPGSAARRGWRSSTGAPLLPVRLARHGEGAGARGGRLPAARGADRRAARGRAREADDRPVARELTPASRRRSSRSAPDSSRPGLEPGPGGRHSRQMPGRRFGADTREMPERPADPAVRKANLRRIFPLFRSYRPQLARRLHPDHLLGAARRDPRVPAPRRPRHRDPGERRAPADRARGRDDPDPDRHRRDRRLPDAPLEPRRPGRHARPAHARSTSTCSGSRSPSSPAPAPATCRAGSRTTSAGSTRSSPRPRRPCSRT